MLKASKSIRLLLVVLCVATMPAWLGAPALGQSSGPTVTRTDPPNWWIGLPPNPMLLVSGQGFTGAKVTTSYPGVKIARTQTSANGHYMFVWLDVAPNAKPGTVRLAINTRGGRSNAQLDLFARQSPPGRFQGLTNDDVIYLIMPDRFADGDTSSNEPAPDLHTFDRSKPRAWHGGDLKGIRARLPYLKDLGVTALWLTPFWKNDWQSEDFSYHGYHVTDFYRVDDHLGSLADLQALTAEAHRLGIKLVLDYVVNHTGPHHPWATDPPQPDWIHGTPEKHRQPEYRFNGIVDPHASERQWINVLNGWFVDKLPDLNPDNPRLAQYLLQNAEWWMESAGLDAFRLDTFPYASRRFWSGWHEGIFRAYPRTFSIGEVMDPDPVIVSFFQGGRKQWDGIDTHLSTVFDYPLEFALRDVILKDTPAQRIVDVLMHDYLYPHPEKLVTFFGNHDIRRFMSEPGATTRKLESAFDLLLTLRGTPQLYYGDEIGMDGGDDPENRRDFPGGFAGDPRNAFSSQGRTEQEQEIFTHVQAALRFRRGHAALRRGKLVHIAWGEKYYAFLRDDGRERLLIVFNNAPETQTLDIPLEATPIAGAKTARPLRNAVPAEIMKGTFRSTVAANTVAIFQIE